MTTIPDPLARLPLRVAFDVSLQAPDGGYQPRAIITPRGGLPSATIEGASRADALALGAAAVMDMPDDGFRLPEDTASRFVARLRNLQRWAADLSQGLIWLHATVQAQARGEPLASVSDLKPRRLLLRSVHSPRRPGAKVRVRDVEGAAHDVFDIAAKVAGAIRDAGKLVQEIEASSEGPTYCSSPTAWVMLGAIAWAAVSLHVALSALGIPGAVVTVAGHRALTITPPVGAMEWPASWARHQAARWSKARAQRIEKLRRLGVEAASRAA